MISRTVICEILNSGCILSSGSDEIWLGWGHPERSETFLSSSLSIYAPDFFLTDKKPWWIFKQTSIIKRSEWIGSLQEFLIGALQEDSGALLNGLTWEIPSFEFFQKTFGELQNLFASGTLEKAVPVLFQQARAQVSARMKALLMLRLLSYTRQLPVKIYGLWNSDEGILGATPEILFEKDPQGTLHTAALAGTRLKDSSRPPILKDTKELKEHQIVIDGICDSLKDFGELSVGETQELDLPTLTHLFTPIRLALSTSVPSMHDFGRFFEKVVRQLHPTPALGAFPREKGLEWLRSYQEHFNRKRLGAPWGAIHPSGESRCWVSIRNLQWGNDRILLGAGCGIIAASELNREWLEIQAKMNSVKKMFALEVSQ